MQSLRRASQLNETSALLRSFGRGSNAAWMSQISHPGSLGNWTPVFDRESGLTYYWNTKTDETTALGAPRPASAAEPTSLLSTRTVELFQMGTIGFGFGLVLSVVNKIL